MICEYFNLSIRICNSDVINRAGLKSVLYKTQGLQILGGKRGIFQ